MRRRSAAAAAALLAAGTLAAVLHSHRGCVLCSPQPNGPSGIASSGGPDHKPPLPPPPPPSPPPPLARTPGSSGPPVLSAITSATGNSSTSSVYSPFNLIWKRPDAAKEGGRMKIDNTSVTGCCDRILSLCIASLLAHYPTGQVVVWTNDFDSARLRTLVNSPRAIARAYDVHEMAKGTPVAAWFQHHETGKFETVHYSDVLRLLILLRHGGSYLDADTVMVETIESLSDRLGLPAQNRTHLVARSDDSCVARFRNSNRASETIYIKGWYKEAGATLRNCSFFPSNGLLFGFPPRFWFFQRALEIIAQEYRPACWGCHGPSLMARVFNLGLAEGRELPRTQPWRHLLFFTTARYLFNKPRDMAHAFRSIHDPRQRIFIHTELDQGDLAEGSTCWFLLRHFTAKLAAIEAGRGAGAGVMAIEAG